MTAIRPEQLSALLSSALGDDVAVRVIREAARAVGVAGEMNQEQALDVLDFVAAKPGIAGVVARFAKTRVLLGL